MIQGRRDGKITHKTFSRLGAGLWEARAGFHCHHSRNIIVRVWVYSAVITLLEMAGGCAACSTPLNYRPAGIGWIGGSSCSASVCLNGLLSRRALL